MQAEVGTKLLGRLRVQDAQLDGVGHPFPAELLPLLNLGHAVQGLGGGRPEVPLQDRLQPRQVAASRTSVPSAAQLPAGLQPVVARDTLHELQAGAGRQHRQVVVQVPVLRADVNADDLQILQVRIHGVRLLHPLHHAHERFRAQPHERLQLQVELLPVASGAVQWDRLSRHPSLGPASSTCSIEF